MKDTKGKLIDYSTSDADELVGELFRINKLISTPFYHLFCDVIDFVASAKEYLKKKKCAPLAHYTSYMHGFSHWKRVGTLSMFILLYSNQRIQRHCDYLDSRAFPDPAIYPRAVHLNKLSTMQLAVLTAALFHDISRVDDSRDTTHGKRGSMLFLEYIHKRYDFKKPSYLSKAEGDLGSGGTFPSYLSLRFDSKIISEIEFACIYHCKAVDKKMHPSGRFHRDFAHVPPIFAILACADRLDRVRCGECPSTKYLYLLDGPLRSRSSVDDCSSPTSKEELKDEEELDEKKFCYYILDKNGEKVRVERERKYGLLPGDIQDKVDDVSFATDVAKLGFYPKDADKSGSLDDTVIHLEDKAGSGHETADGVPPSTKEFSFITPSSESTRAIELLKSSIDPVRFVLYCSEYPTRYPRFLKRNAPVLRILHNETSANSKVAKYFKYLENKLGSDWIYQITGKRW
eukprot:gnl/Carplike_NY0171/3616_a4889_344.p1 GENE.gnl/Carplike_NY0171/3616_a4889_344~~gnl/Carplike_NY0171/3616_a4889_344.p1  ORF type:complete len:458 (-),score=69.97 gnl/Carplike_NY0171/3616_a4889_344:48-1421(-)